MDIVDIADNLFSFLTIVAQILVVAIVIAVVTKNEKLEKLIGDKALLLAFLVALVSTLGSLFYSEIAGYDPCKLCWIQRILMYPQALLLGSVLFWKRGLEIISKNSFILSVVGAAIAGYHYLLQIGVTESASCGLVGYSSSCSQVFVMNWGYITIPMMALSGFLLIAALNWILSRRHKYSLLKKDK